MTTAFTQSIHESADRIIDMSVIQKDNMESWADVFARVPDSQNVNRAAGFVTNATKPNTMEIVVDVQAPVDDTTALVRAQAIEIVQDTNGNERYNQVSMHFDVDYSLARKLVEKGSSINREDIAELLHAGSSQLVMLSVSDETGKNSSTGELLGKRQELVSDELAKLSPDTEDELLQTIQTVVTKLEDTAQREANAL